MDEGHESHNWQRPVTMIVVGILLVCAFFAGIALPPMGDSDRQRGWIMAEVKNNMSTEAVVGIMVVGWQAQTFSDAYAILLNNESVALGIEVWWTENNHFVVTAIYKNTTNDTKILWQPVESIPNDVVRITLILENEVRGVLYEPGQW